MTDRTYTVTSRSHAILAQRLGTDPVCSICLGPIRVHDTIILDTSSARHTIRHTECIDQIRRHHP